jgi:hypothetical protein
MSLHPTALLQSQARTLSSNARGASPGGGGGSWAEHDTTRLQLAPSGHTLASAAATRGSAGGVGVSGLQHETSMLEASKKLLDALIGR